MEKVNYIEDARPMTNSERVLFKSEVAGYIVGGVFAVASGVTACLGHGETVACGAAVAMGMISATSLETSVLLRIFRKHYL